MLKQLASSFEGNGRDRTALDYYERAAEAEKHKTHLRRFILEGMRAAELMEESGEDKESHERGK